MSVVETVKCDACTPCRVLLALFCLALTTTDIWKTHVQTLCNMDIRKVICILNSVRVVILILHFSSEMPFLKLVLEETVQPINDNFYKAETYSRAIWFKFYTSGKQPLRIEFPDYLGRDVGHLLLHTSIGCRRRKEEEEWRWIEEKMMIRNRRIRRKIYGNWKKWRLTGKGKMNMGKKNNNGTEVKYICWLLANLISLFELPCYKAYNWRCSVTVIC
jgi:hypothetical protein